jgi:predicted P-loop ATPase
MEGRLNIAVGKSRRDTKWRNVEMNWLDLVQRLSEVHRTPETVREYKAMSKDEQGRTKDIGGFVGGQLSGGHRKNDSVVNRWLVTLDADNATPDTFEDAMVTWEWEMAVYSTHSHTPEKPRLRFVIPLNRAVSPEEYPAIARKLASRIGMEVMDPSTYEPARLMYWPSCPKDGEFFFQYVEGETIDPDAVLAEYGLGDAWRDTTLWPIAKGEQEIRVKEAKRQGDPEEKPGIVGLFCRAYGIEDAMDELIPGVYEPAGEHRFTYTAGSTAAGAVEYEGKFLYSHHGTDPCGGQLVNAFDMVRIHKFGEMDEGQENQDINRRPSYAAMCEYAAGLDKVKQQKASELGAALDDLSGTADEDTDWTKQLSIDKKGAVDLTLKNLLLIMENDPNLKGITGYNELLNRAVALKRAPWDTRTDEIPEGGTSWRDVDNAGLRWYLETVWKLVGKDKIQDALDIVRERHSFDPVRDYLLGLEWDGVKRLDTMLIRWMGAEDTPYVRAVTRKWMCAAVKRALVPGCKFDNMLILVGKQGIGKSNLARALSRGWFTDSLGRMDSSKDAYERLSGVWIAEIAELAAAKKAEVEDIKNFISKQEDTFRRAYARETSVSPRRCVFYGSTNDQEFLRDRTGARRFWPVEVIGFDNGVLKGFEDEVDQLWAEAVVRYREGEVLWLDNAEVAQQAAEIQDLHTAVDEWTDEISTYLDTLLPEDWDSRDRMQRRAYFDWQSGGVDDLGAEKPGTVRRVRVSGTEIRWECFGIKSGNANDSSARRISNLMNNMPGWRRIKRVYKDRCYGAVRGWERDG